MNPYDCEEQAGSFCDDCFTKEPNKVVHVAFVEKGYTIDKTSATTFITTLLAAELACKAIIHRNVIGTYTPETVTGPGAGTAREENIGMNHTVAFQTYAASAKEWVIENNKFIRRAKFYDMYYFTETKGWQALKRVTYKPGVPITDDNTQMILGSVEVTWTDKDMPVPYDANSEDLEDCQLLFDAEELELVSAGDETVTGTTIVIEQGTNLDVTIDTDVTSIVDLAVYDSTGTLFTGIDVSLTGADVISLTKTAIAATIGTYNLYVLAENACGIKAAIPFILTVTAP